MRRVLIQVALIPLSVVAMGTALANAPAPPPRPEVTRLVAPVVIKRGALRGEDRDVLAKIQIPAALVHGGRAGAAPGGAPGPTGNTPASRSAPAPDKQSNAPALGTIIAGIALSLAAVSALFVVRGKRTTKTVAVASLAAAALLAGWSAAQADIPVEPRRPEPQIVIELVEDGETVTLLLPR